MKELSYFVWDVCYQGVQRDQVNWTHILQNYMNLTVHYCRNLLCSSLHWVIWEGWSQNNHIGGPSSRGIERSWNEMNMEQLNICRCWPRTAWLCPWTQWSTTGSAMPPSAWPMSRMLIIVPGEMESNQGKCTRKLLYWLHLSLLSYCQTCL